MLQTTVVENIKIDFMLNRFFSRKSAVYEVMWKNTVLLSGTQAEDMAHVHSILDT